MFPQKQNAKTDEQKQQNRFIFIIIFFCCFALTKKVTIY